MIWEKFKLSEKRPPEWLCSTEHYVNVTLCGFRSYTRVIIKPAAGLISDHARPSTGTLLTRKLQMCLVKHYCDAIRGTVASQITNLTIVYTTVYPDADQSKHQTPCHWTLCGNSRGTGEFPAQMANNAENASIWWRHHDYCDFETPLLTRCRHLKWPKQSRQSMHHMWMLSSVVSSTDTSELNKHVGDMDK